MALKDRQLERNSCGLTGFAEFPCPWKDFTGARNVKQAEKIIFHAILLMRQM